jgi:hypothetical protein
VYTSSCSSIPRLAQEQVSPASTPIGAMLRPMSSPHSMNLSASPQQSVGVSVNDSRARVTPEPPLEPLGQGLTFSRPTLWVSAAM